MKTVLLRGPAITQSGYGIHCRQIAKWLREKEKNGVYSVITQPLGWGDTSWILDRDRFDGIVGWVMSRAMPQQTKSDVSIQLQLPNEWDPSLANFNVGMTAAVETDKCNPQWINCCNAMDLVIVPSQHTKRTLEQTGQLTTRVVVVPEAFPESFENNEIVDIDIGLETSFNFLVFGQLTGNNPENDRKNIFYTLKWLCETFKDTKDVGIIVKTNSSRNTRIDRNVVKNTLERLLAEVRPAKQPPIYLVHGDMNEKEIYSLLRHPSVKALVNLTRGEGFGLPILEAAVTGLPVIATNWSAHTEFLNQGKWIQIDYSLTPIHDTRVDGNIFMKDTRWANPNEDNFKRRVKKFYENSSIPRQWASELSEKLKQTHCLKAIFTHYDEVIGDLFR